MGHLRRRELCHIIYEYNPQKSDWHDEQLGACLSYYNSYYTYKTRSKHCIQSLL